MSRPTPLHLLRYGYRVGGVADGQARLPATRDLSADKKRGPYAIRVSSAWLTMVDVIRWEALPSP